MKTLVTLSTITLMFMLAIAMPASQGGTQTIAGKWLAKADTPNGPVDLVFEIQQEGNQVYVSLAKNGR